MPFDFHQYLASLDDSQTYDIHNLTGGFVNETVRATLRCGKNNISNKFGTSSIILKYAPPYVAGRGPDAPMTQTRQVIEAHALALLRTTPSLDNAVKVPRLLRHDPDLHIIIMTDLGNWPNMSEVLSLLGGYRRDEAASTKGLTTVAQVDSGVLTHLPYLGAEVGTFLASLHSRQTFEFVKYSKDPALSLFSSPDMRNTWYEIAIKAVRSQLSLFPSILSQNEAASLADVVEKDFIRLVTNVEQSFVLGDCWTASILIQPDAKNGESEVGIVDWEFASFGRGMHGDLAQLVAHLELFRIAAAHQCQYELLKAIDGFTTQLMSSYKHQSKLQKSAWTQTDPPELYIRILRSAFLFQAAEMINCAIWKVWPCNADECLSVDGNHTKVIHDCVLVKKLIERAVWYLRHAQMSPEEFATSSNWSELMEAKTSHHNWGLLDLVVSL